MPLRRSTDRASAATDNADRQRWGTATRRQNVGRTSLRVRIEMHREDLLSGDRSICTTGEFVMVAVNEEGRPTAIEDEGAA